MKNVACYRLGTMLHLEIQMDKEAMEKLTFQKYLGGTEELMKRLIMATKGCGQLTSNETYFTGSQLSGVKKAEEDMDEGVDYCGLVKTSHKDFCIATLEKLMKYWPGGSYLAMKITSRIPNGIPLIEIGYK